MRRLSCKNKRALSEMVSYVLLIIIAVGLATVTYVYIKGYIPKDKPSCQEDIHIALNKYSCNTAGTLSLTLENNGLFKINQAYVRLVPINENRLPTLISEEPAEKQLNEGGNKWLNPGKIIIKKYTIPTSISLVNGEKYSLEIEPAILVAKWSDPVLCERAIIRQSIEC